jgi:hypothetical protein
MQHWRYVGLWQKTTGWRERHRWMCTTFQQLASSASCSPAALGVLTEAYCLVAADSAVFVLEFCPLACAGPFVGWWQRCGTSNDLAKFDGLVVGQLSQYFTVCVAQLSACR